MDSWSDVAVGGATAADLDLAEVRRALGLLTDPAFAFEVRGVNPPGRAHGTVCRTVEEGLLAAADHANMKYVFVTLNPIRTDARSASKAAVVARRWLLLDVDPIRPAGVSSTDAEKAAAMELVGRILDHLQSLGWPAPLVNDSGNGWHVLYRIDLPNTDLAQQECKAALAALADRFDTDAAKVERSTHDAPRIAKLPGTWARKGDDLPDRPHRLARVAWAPDRLEPVPAGLLHAMAGGKSPPTPPPADGHGPAPWEVPVTAGGSKVDVYVQRAIEGECGKVALAVPGDRGGKGRNNQLNESACALGTMAGWPEMREAYAKDALRRAAEAAGLAADSNCGPAQILTTIESGWRAGSARPRRRPDPPANGQANGQANGHAGPDLAALGRLTIGADEVTPEAVSWLWPDVLALGFINLFAGRTGVGKSFVLCDVACRLSRGDPMPDGSPARPANGTLFISEDPYQYVLVPRIRELKGDRSRIGFMQWRAMAAYELGNVDLLQRAWEERNRPELIIIDPPANFLGAKDEHRNAEIRSVLMKLVEWLEKKPVALALITHYNKGGAQKVLDALDRIMGSVAWSSSSRVACGIVTDPQTPDQMIFGGIKNNLGAKAPPLAYRIVKTPSLATIEWLGPSKTSLDDAMNKKKSRGECAVEWITEQFRRQPEYESEKLKNMAYQAGFSKNALFSPEVNALPIQKKPRTTAAGDSFWVWRAIGDWPPKDTKNGQNGKSDGSTPPY